MTKFSYCKTGVVEREHVEAVDFSGKHNHSLYSFQASYMMILFPHIITIPILFCCPLVASTHIHLSQIHKGVKSL